MPVKTIADLTIGHVGYANVTLMTYAGTLTGTLTGITTDPDTTINDLGQRVVTVRRHAISIENVTVTALEPSTPIRINTEYTP